MHSIAQTLIHNSSSAKLTVEEVATEAQRASFLDIFRRVYMAPASPGEPYSGLSDLYLTAITQSVVRPAPFAHHLLGSIGPIPVAVASFCYADAFAAIYNVAVLPEHRRKGLGAEISLACATQAYNINPSTLIFLQTELGSANETFYKNLGFEIAFVAECLAQPL